MLATKRKLSHVTKGSIFDDRDLFTPEESAVLKVKSALLDAIQQEVDRKRYTQARLGKILDEYQPNVSNLLRGKISKFSIDKLVYYVSRLGLKTSMNVGSSGNRQMRQAVRPSRRKNGTAAA